MLTEDQIRYTKYRWEFLRRNPDYIKDFKQLQRTIEEKHGGTWESDVGMPSDEERAFCKKWGIGQPFSPGLGYKDMVEAPDLSPEQREIALQRLYVGLQPLKNLVPLGDSDAYFLPGGGIQVVDYDLDELISVGKIAVEIEIDLNCSRNQLEKEILAHLDKWIEHYRSSLKRHLRNRTFNEKKNTSPSLKEFREAAEKELEKELAKRQKKANRRLHYDNFDSYIAVYDLKQRGKSWSQIQQALKFSNSTTPRDHYKSARRLIKEGFPVK